MLPPSVRLIPLPEADPLLGQTTFAGRDSPSRPLHAGMPPRAGLHKRAGKATRRALFVQTVSNPGTLPRPSAGLHTQGGRVWSSQDLPSVEVTTRQIRKP